MISDWMSFFVDKSLSYKKFIEQLRKKEKKVVNEPDQEPYAC